MDRTAETNIVRIQRRVDEGKPADISDTFALLGYITALREQLQEARKAVENHAEAVTRLHDSNLTAEALLMALTSIGSRLGLDKSASPKIVMGAFEEYYKNADRLREERDTANGIIANTKRWIEESPFSHDAIRFVSKIYSLLANKEGADTITRLREERDAAQVEVARLRKAIVKWCDEGCRTWMVRRDYCHVCPLNRFRYSTELAQGEGDTATAGTEE